MLKPCPKNSASPSCRLGSTDSAYSVRCTWSGARIMIRSASAAASAGVTTRRPSASAFGRLLLPSGRPTRTSTPESRSDSACVPLAAVPQDGDGAPLDDRQVGVVVVEDLGGHAVRAPSVVLHRQSSGGWNGLQA